jgi:hypothetical protein
MKNEVVTIEQEARPTPLLWNIGQRRLPPSWTARRSNRCRMNKNARHG